MLIKYIKVKSFVMKGNEMTVIKKSAKVFPAALGI